MNRSSRIASPSTAMRLKAGPSRIAGTGCFAAVRLKRGGIVGEYTGDRVSHAEADRRYEHIVETYLFAVDEEEVIDAMGDENPVKYINHSCDPNCESEQQGKRVFIRALRDIEPDEELTYDYCLELGDEAPDPYDCRCGSRECRGTMIAMSK